ncbi:MAG: winged helix DNA-binding domain-containing protein, partial [Chloroflexi bacterium]|nr:winged helix DNA-binding domain-containing protein [Chloroflexota bacterium]
MADLSLSEARRIALAAQGFSTPRNGASGGQPPGLDDLRRVISHLNLLQIDTVNVLARAHYMPVYSRLGPYEIRLIDDLAYVHRELFEYWAHAASFIPMRLYPVLKHRMVTRREKWLEKVRTEYPGFVERVLDQVRERGPISVSDLEDSGGRTGPWWGL